MIETEKSQFIWARLVQHAPRSRRPVLQAETDGIFPAEGTKLNMNISTTDDSKSVSFVQLSPQMILKSSVALNGMPGSQSDDTLHDALPLRPLRLLNQSNNNGSLP